MSTTFDPTSDLIQEKDCNTLLLYLPGFTKEQLRVQLTRSKVVKISGSRAIGDNKWSSFQKDFLVPENCDTSRISAKFEEGILYVRQPKVIVPEDDDKKVLPPKPIEEPPKIDQERQPTTPNPDDSKHSGHVKDFPDKSSEKKEEKPTYKDEKVWESEVGKKAEENGGVGDDDDQKVAAATSYDDKREKSSGTNVIANKVDGFSMVNAAARLKMGREKMMKILLILFAVALGMYVSKLPWFSGNH